MNPNANFQEMNIGPYRTEEAVEEVEKPNDIEDIRVSCNDETYQCTELSEFSDANFPPQFYTIFNQMGFVRPTSIQKFAIPIAMDCKDLIGVAKTGSGKTLAFMLPALQAVLDERSYYYEQNKFYDNKMTPMALVQAPTRELANQIYESAKDFGNAVNISMRVVYGGQDIFTQKKKLREGVDILIGTPGRIIDLIERNALNLSRVFYWVLDEADRMLDMGFLPQVKTIISVLPQERQTLMWSATWPKEVQTLANEVCLYSPVSIHVGEENLTINSKIEQIILCMNEGKKFDELCQIMNDVQRANNKAKIQIFARTKRGCDQLCESLEGIGFRAYSIHGDKSQVKRDTIIAQYKKSYKNILVATDVASRGLDIKDIGFVINFDFPMTIEDYIHRIGRTGRAGASGCSYTFFTSNDNSFSTTLITVLRKSGQKVPPMLQDWNKEFNNKKVKSKPYTFSRYNQNFYSNNERPFKFNGYNNQSGGGYNGGGGGGFNNRGANYNNNNGGGFNQQGGGGFGQLQRGSLYKTQTNMVQNTGVQNTGMQNNTFYNQPSNFTNTGGVEGVTNCKSKNPGLFAAQPQNPVPVQNVVQNVQYNNENVVATNDYYQQPQNYEDNSQKNNDFNNYSNTYHDTNTQDYYGGQNNYNAPAYDNNQQQQAVAPNQQNPRSNTNNNSYRNQAANNGNTGNNYNKQQNYNQDYNNNNQMYNNNGQSKFENKFDEKPRAFTNSGKTTKNAGLFAVTDQNQPLNQIGKNQGANPNLYADN